MPGDFKPGDRIRRSSAWGRDGIQTLGTMFFTENSDGAGGGWMLVERATYLSAQDEADLRIGRAIRAEYDRQLAAFRKSGSPWVHLVSPSFDFGSCTVREIIDGK